MQKTAVNYDREESAEGRSEAETGRTKIHFRRGDRITGMSLANRRNQCLAERRFIWKRKRSEGINQMKFRLNQNSGLGP